MIQYCKITAKFSVDSLNKWVYKLYCTVKLYNTVLLTFVQIRAALFSNMIGSKILKNLKNTKNKTFIKW